MKSSNIMTSRKRIRGFMLIFILIYACLIFRIGWIQFVNGYDLQIKAYKQQTRDGIISPKRGIIYSSKGTPLAVSKLAETVTIEPKNIETEDKPKIAKAISETLELDYETVLAKLNKNTSIETIARKIEKEKTDNLKNWMKEENITKGINIDEDTKRYYPYNNLASNIIGFCGIDNQGLEGLEKTYDDILKGVSRKSCCIERCIWKGNSFYI